ncbi:MAG: diphthine synthase [archaeon]
MLYLVGIGLKPAHLTLEALEVLRSCDQVFLEAYTSEYAQGFVDELKTMIGKDFKALGRKEVEEQFESAMLSATKNKMALMIFGNALTATTHLQILLDAKEKMIKTKVIPGISITNLVAETGLDEYKFGRIVTICYHSPEFEPESFYDQIKENQKMGLHTLCLLDIKKDIEPKRLMSCEEAICVLEKIAAKRKEKLKWNYIGMLGMGGEKQAIIIGKEKIVSFKDINHIYPQSLIIPGKMNDKEKEALETLNK